MRSNKLKNVLTYHQHIHPFITQPCIIMHQTLINCNMMRHSNSALKMQITFKVSVGCKILRFNFIFDMVLPQMFSSNKRFFCKFGTNLRLVLRFECDTLFPATGRFPDNWQTFDISKYFIHPMMEIKLKWWLCKDSNLKPPDP